MTVIETTEDRVICVLPTEEWSEINPDNLPKIIVVSAKQFIKLSSGEITIRDLCDNNADANVEF